MKIHFIRRSLKKNLNLRIISKFRVEAWKKIISHFEKIPSGNCNSGKPQFYTHDWD